MKKSRIKGEQQGISGHDFHLRWSTRDPREEERDIEHKISRTLEETATQPLHLQAISLSVLAYSTLFLVLKHYSCFCGPQGRSCDYAQISEIFLKLFPVQWREKSDAENQQTGLVFTECLFHVQKGSIWLIFGCLNMFHHPPGLKAGTLEWQELKRCYLN